MFTVTWTALDVGVLLEYFQYNSIFAYSPLMSSTRDLANVFIVGIGVVVGAPVFCLISSDTVAQ